MKIHTSLKQIGRKLNPGYDYLELIEAQGKDLHSISEIDRIKGLLAKEKDPISKQLLEERVSKLHASHEHDTISLQTNRNCLYLAFASPAFAYGFDNELVGFGVAAAAIISYMNGTVKGTDLAKNRNVGYRRQDSRQRREYHE